MTSSAGPERDEPAGGASAGPGGARTMPPVKPVDADQAEPPAGSRRRAPVDHDRTPPTPPDRPGDTRPADLSSASRRPTARASGRPGCAAGRPGCRRSRRSACGGRRVRSRQHDRDAVVAALADGHLDRHLAEQRHLGPGRRRPASRPPPGRRRSRTAPAGCRRAAPASSCSPPRRRSAGGSAARSSRPARPPRAAASCGVVTTSSSADGTSWASEIAMSPVPGGRSISSTSRSPQYTSARNCCSARCSIGPRQTTGGVARGEHADRDHLHAVRLRRHDHLLDLGRLAGDAEHPRDREAVDVGVQHADRQAALRPARPPGSPSPSDLPTPPLPEATAYTRVGEPGWANGISLTGLSPRSLVPQLRALLVGHHAELAPARESTPGTARHRGGDVGGQRLPHRAAGDGQQHAAP